ncbi:MAG: response regulator, partial [Lachnospiraceae bacterium]|nr:response regulator [Lachnospiraceae bacterium]
MIRMILADDEPVITRGIRRLLDWERLGIEIIGEYEDGKRALEAIVSKKPEIALLDISMPGMTGVEILKECRAMGSRISIIFVSGFQDFEYAKAALEYGATAYLLKPVIREELLAAVEKSIPALRRENETGKEAPEEAAMEGGIDYGFLMEEENTRY